MRRLKDFQVFEDKKLKVMREEAARFVAELWSLPAMKYPPSRWLSFIGISGTGKTFLARLILRCWPEHYIEPIRGATLQRECKFIHWPGMIRKFRSGEVNLSRRIQDVIDYPFLVVDEIGADRDKSGFANDILCQVVSGRVGKPTMFTSNLTFEALQGIDGRIASRLIRDENVLVRIDEKDTVDFATRPRTSGLAL